MIGTGYNRLFRNNGDGSFTRITGDPIVTYNHWAGGSSWGDFENDGDLDMFVGGYDGINLLFVNNGNGSFTRIDTGIVVNDGGYKMGALWGDYDNDGDIDLFVARNNYFGGNNVLYMNNGNNNKWINMRCVGMVSNKSAVGAKVFVRALINSSVIRQMQVVSSQTGGSISGQSSLNAEFGLGNANIIDSIRIEWPSGIIDKYVNIPVNQFVTAVEGQGLVYVKQDNQNIPIRFALYQNYPNPFNPVTRIKFDIPTPLTPPEGRSEEFVTLQMYDILGREIITLVDESLKPGTPACRSLGPGRYEVEWDGSNYPSGVYFYKLMADDFVETKKMVLIK